MTVVLVVWLSVRFLLNYGVLGKGPTAELIPENVDMTLKNIKYTKTRAGEPLWTLVADSAHSMQDGVTRIENVRIVFFDREMGDIELTADRGELLPEHKAVTASSNVRVVSSSGNSLQTEFLKYEETSNILQTDRMVKISRDNLIVVGKGMQMDVVKRTFVLLSDVKAQAYGLDNI